MKNVIKLFILLLIASINFNLIIFNSRIVVGGTQGVSLLIYRLYKISPHIIIFLLNSFLFLLSLIFLPKRTTGSVVISSFIYPLFVKMTSTLRSIKIVNNYYIKVITCGIISGFTVGEILKMGYSTGGINILIIIFKQYFKISEYISNFVINLGILLGGLFIFGIKSTLWSVLVLSVNSLVIKKINKNVNHCQTKERFSG